MKVAQGEPGRLVPGQRKEREPALDIVRAQCRIGGPAAQRGQVPIGKEERLVEQPLVVVRRHVAGRRPVAQGQENVDGGAVERGLVAALGQQLGEALVAQVFEQQEAAVRILSEDFGRAQPPGAQQLRDTHEWAHVFPAGRRIHQDGPARLQLHPLVAPERGIARQRPAHRAVPARRREKAVDFGRPVNHREGAPRAGSAIPRRSEAPPRGHRRCPGERNRDRAAPPAKAHPGARATRSG